MLRRWLEVRDLTLCFVLLVAPSPSERPGVLLTHLNVSVSEEDYALASHSCKVGAKNKHLHINLRSYIEMPGVYLCHVCNCIEFLNWKLHDPYNLGSMMIHL